MHVARDVAPDVPVLPLGAPMPARAALTGVPTYLFVAAIHWANASLYGRRGPGEAGVRG